ncbi:hypothetical protein SMU82_09022, partial [Streptococcus mutans SM6]
PNKLCGGGTIKSKSPFHDDLPIFVPLSQDRFKDGTDLKLTVKTAFSQLCQSWKSGFTVLFLSLR